MAGQVYRFLTSRGIHIPGDVSIICAKESRYTRSIGGGLTSVVYPVGKVCKSAVEIMDWKIQNHTLGRIEKPVLIKSEIHPGGSCECDSCNPDYAFWEEELFFSLENPGERYFVPPPK